jgi:hypothetical protein
MASSEAIGAEEEGEKTSTVLLRLADSHRGPRIFLGEVAAALGDRGIGLTIFVLALPNLLPGPVMPGYSTVFGVPMAVLSVRLVRSHHDASLPAWIGRRSLPVARFRHLVLRTAPWLRRVETVLHPRPSWLTSTAGVRVVGATLVVTALVLALPVPFVAWLPTIAVMVLALGLIEKDSRALSVGMVLAVLSWAAAGVLVLLGAAILSLLGGWLD